MCDKAVLENGGTSESVPDQSETQEMCERLLRITVMHQNLLLNAISLKNV